MYYVFESIYIYIILAKNDFTLHFTNFTYTAYMHELYYARLANKVYSNQSNHLQDNEIALTVNAYSTNINIAKKQSRLTRKQLKFKLLQQYPGLNYDDMINKMVLMLKELFQGLASSVGKWPQSSAYYAVDVIFDNVKNVIQHSYVRVF